MRQKEEKLIITFFTTAQAIAMEQLCKENKIPGRLIPIPTQLSAGCGLAFCMPPQLQKQIECFIKEHHLEKESIGIYFI